MTKKIIAFILFQTLVSCSASKATLYLHESNNDGASIFGNPKIGFFHDKSIAKEIKIRNVNLTKSQYTEIKKLLMQIKKRGDLSDFNLAEAPHDIALVINNDTLYGYGDSWLWRKKAIVFNSMILKKLVANEFKRIDSISSNQSLIHELRH